MDRQHLLSLGVFSDAHFSSQVIGDRVGPDSADKLRACLETFRQREVPMVLNLGDALGGEPTEAATLERLDTFREIFCSFEGERFVVLGNHDVEDLTKQEYLARSGALVAAPYYSVDRSGVHFVVLDGNCHEDGTDFARGAFDWATAWVSDIQLAWLRDDLAAARDRVTVVFCHENLDDRGVSDPGNPHVVRNAAAVREVLRSFENIAAVLGGHYHHGLITSIGRAPCLVLTAMGVGPGPGNNAYGILSVFSDGSIELEGFGRQPSFPS